MTAFEWYRLASLLAFPVFIAVLWLIAVADISDSIARDRRPIDDQEEDDS